MDSDFLSVMQAIRDDWGRPMVPTSGSRCKLWNKIKGGADNSQHLLGKAGDWPVNSSGDKYRLVELAIYHGMKGIFIYRNFIHLDTRDGPPVLDFFS